MRGVSTPACLLALVGTLLPCVSNALTLGHYTYTTNSAGKATITGFNSSYSGALTVTNNLDGCPVVAIANNAFRERTRLTSVTIPDTVTSIGTWAFAYCTGLASAMIGTGVASIPERAFHNCSALTSIAIPDNVKSIGEDAFSGCTSLRTADIGDGVTKIGFAAFFWCWELAHVAIGSKVATIEDLAFLGCESLVAFVVDAANPTYSSLDGVLFNKGLTTLIQCPATKPGSYAVPATVTAVRDSAFEACAALTDVTVPASVASIGFFAFYGCSALSAIAVDAANPAYSSVDGVLFDKAVNTLIQFPGGKAGRYAIPGGVTAIGDLALQGCSSLTHVTVPASVGAIGSYAFDDCQALATVLFLGDAPQPADAVFMMSSPTLCYLPGAGGWGATFDNLPALCWNPSVRSDASLGFSGGVFGFTVDGTPGIPVGVEATTNLSTTVWTSVTNGTVGAGGSIAVGDPDSAGHPVRLYRVVFP